MKDIVILADFCGPLDGTFNSRFLYLADMLSDDNDVEIITSDFNHGEKKYFSGEIEKHTYAITLLHEGSYSKNVCLKRFLAHLVWGSNVKKYLNKRKKPDVIYAAIPPLTGPFSAAQYCRKNKIKFVIDVQDLWPEAFKMVFNIPIISDIVFMPFSFLANSIYRNAKEICAVSKSYADRAIRAKNNECCGTVVYLGTDLETFDSYADQAPVLEKEKDEFWIGYCGTLGASYDITCVIDALETLGNDKVKFIVMGDGPRRVEFEEYAEMKKVPAIFTGRLSYEKMCSTLVHCDIAVNPITKGAAQSIINKHADYAASGLPVISTQESMEYRDLVDEYDMGFNCNNSDCLDLAEKIKILISDEELKKSKGRNARRCAEERFDRKFTYQKLVNAILK